MSTNRLMLICNICNVGIRLAKFYPEGGWEASFNVVPPRTPDSPDEEHGLSKLNTFFKEHDHGLSNQPFGGYQFRMEYEVTRPPYEDEATYGGLREGK